MWLFATPIRVCLEKLITVNEDFNSVAGSSKLGLTWSHERFFNLIIKKKVDITYWNVPSIPVKCTNMSVSFGFAMTSREV